MIITRLWRSQPGRYFCISTKSSTGKWVDHFFKRNELGKVTPFLHEHADKDLYFCPHGFDRPRRLKPYAVMPKLLWSDMDEADPRKCALRPTIAIESSPGRFVGLWVTDDAITEELNRRLTYFLGSDASGWDLTQVLRVPGTINYKYDSLPRTRLLWTDGPQYSIEKIERKLPDLEDDGDSESDAAEVFKEYEKKLPPWCRRELMSGKPTQGKRSEMIWKLVNTLVECGVSVEDTFTLIKASPWNKFKGRYSEDRQLQREIDKVLNRHFSSSKPAGERKEDDYGWLQRTLADVEPENINWLWYPYLARGELTILEGDPGLGKSYLAQIVSGHIIDGIRLPSVKKLEPVKGRVVYFDIENSAESVTVKRIRGNGFENLANYIQEEGLFSIDDEDRLSRVYDALERVKPTLIVFDTLNTYLGKADAFKGHEAQQAFVKFKAMAKRFNCSVLVLRHLTKGGAKDTKALYRGQGSIAFAGIARIIITVGTMPEDADTRAFAITKMNIAKRPPAHTFRILALPDTRDEKDRSKFEWGEYVEVTADEILQVPQKAQASDDAKEFLENVLDDGPMEWKKIERMAEARNISTRTLHRAADEVGVIKKVQGFGAKRSSTWSLPDAA